MRLELFWTTIAVLVYKSVRLILSPFAEFWIYCSYCGGTLPMDAKAVIRHKNCCDYCIKK